ncbi:hypothetical protein FE257_008612 [Aspergillus nanangensis]|uniref:Uncharacterized protein n=1 Tax=Aspergillus nanangensis TaxID=2582783 RepID=A0AAD4GTC9_ASPNN|nr:hypothetical protein FE257_008612 [Aspergillus nanangensis]
MGADIGITKHGYSETERKSDAPVSPVEHNTVNAPARQQFNALTLLSMAFVICNSWAGIAGSIQLALLQGGPVTLVYSILITTTAYVAMGISLAELASVYPTAGGQYHFASVLSPPYARRALSYACGLLSMLSWVAIGVSVVCISSEQLISVVAVYHGGFVTKSWQVFLVYQATAFLALLYNIFALKRAPWSHRIGFFMTLSLFLVSIIGMLVRAVPKQPHTFVWATFINQTGWPDGVCFVIGLSSSCYMYIGLDASLHMAEECTTPEKTVPRTIMAAITIGFVTAFCYTVVALYGLTDIEKIITTDEWVPYIVSTQGFRSTLMASIYTVLSFVMAMFIIIAVQETFSRLAWAFARDEGLILSNYIQRIHPKLDVPVFALIFTWLLLCLCGIIYLASETAVNALIQSSVILQQVSFFIPIVLLLLRKRSTKFLPVRRPFKLPGILGWVANIYALAFIAVTTVFFSMPNFIPTSAATMNYTCVILGIALFLGLLNWWLRDNASPAQEQVALSVGIDGKSATKSGQPVQDAAATDCNARGHRYRRKRQETPNPLLNGSPGSVDVGSNGVGVTEDESQVASSPPSTIAAETNIPSTQSEHSETGLQWDSTIGSFCILYQTPLVSSSSSLLLQHYLEVTARVLAAKPMNKNPFVTYLLPIAYSDGLVMHSILALSGSHMSLAKPTATEISRSTWQHYAAVVRQLRRELDQISFNSNAKNLRLLLVLLIAISGDQTGAIFPHLRASRQLILNIRKHPDEPWSAENQALQGFAIEVYAYLALVGNITPYGKFIDRTLPLDDFVTDLSPLRKYNTFGTFFGCGHVLFEMIAPVSQFYSLRLAEEQQGTVSLESVSTYEMLLSRIQGWESTGPESDMEPWRSEHEAAGESYRNALLIYLKTSMCGPVVSSPKVVFEIQRHVDVILDLWTPLCTSPYVSIFLWPVLIAGSCCVREDQRTMIKTRLRSIVWNMNHILFAATLLDLLWTDDDMRAYGPYGLHFVMEKHGINLCVA